MAQSIIPARYPPHIDPTRTPLAYADRALPRLNRELQDSSLLTRQRAVRALCDYLKDPEHVASAVEWEIPKTLKKLLNDNDLTVRQKATDCFYSMAEHAVGRLAILHSDIIEPVSRLFNDREPLARFNAHKTIEMLCENEQGATGVLAAQLVPLLVEKLKVEAEPVKELILDSLHFCMLVDPLPALAAGALPVFTALLFHEWPSIKAKAARDLADITMPLAGKEKALQVQSLPALIALLGDKHADVKAWAARAIGSIAITTPAKYAAIENLAIPRLIEHVDDGNSEVRVNCLKALTCLAEAPEGRQTLLKVVPTIQSRQQDEVPAVAKAATIAVSVILWKP